MLQRLGKLFVDFWIVLAFGLAAVLLMPQAHAGLIGTDAGSRAGRARAGQGACSSARSSPRAWKRWVSSRGMRRRASTRCPTPRCFSSPAGSTPRSPAARSATRQLLLIIIIILLLVILL